MISHWVQRLQHIQKLVCQSAHARHRKTHLRNSILECLTNFGTIWGCGSKFQTTHTLKNSPDMNKLDYAGLLFCTPSVWKISLLGFDPSSHASCASLEKTDLLSERKPQTCNTKIVQSSLWIYKIFYHLSAEEGQQEYIITVSHTFSQWSENLLTPVMEKPRWELAQNLDLRFFSSPSHGLKQHHFETSLWYDNLNLLYYL